jgi:phosphatidate cytidylyltransferase
LRPEDQPSSAAPQTSSGIDWRGLGRRAATGLVLAGGSWALIWLGALPFTLEVLVLCLLGVSEFYQLAMRKGYRPARRTGLAATVLLILGSYFFGRSALSDLMLAFVPASLVVLLLRKQNRVSALADGAITVLGFVYVGWLPAHMVLIRRMDQSLGATSAGLGGAELVTLLALTVAMTDIGAYFAGKILGRHKMAPHISPNKTWEGSLGGFASAVAASWLYGGFLGLPPGHRVALGLVISLAAQLGDLWESAVKRDVGVKDSGDIVEGHGGVLDRFDSFLLSAPAFYFYVKWFM